MGRGLDPESLPAVGYPAELAPTEAPEMPAVVRPRATVAFSPTSPASTTDGEIVDSNPAEPQEAVAAVDPGPVAQAMAEQHFGSEWLSEAAKYVEENPVKPREADKEAANQAKSGSKWFQTASGWNRAVGDALDGN